VNDYSPLALAILIVALTVGWVIGVWLAAFQRR